jgi:hypothetical protein
MRGIRYRRWFGAVRGWVGAAALSAPLGGDPQTHEDRDRCPYITQDRKRDHARFRTVKPSKGYASRPKVP